MWILELQIVLLLEILSYSALHGLAVFKLQGKPAEKRAKMQNAVYSFQHIRCDPPTHTHAAADIKGKAADERNLRLMAGRSAGDITHTVLPLHLPTVCDLHFQPCSTNVIDTSTFRYI